MKTATVYTPIGVDDDEIQGFVSRMCPGARVIPTPSGFEEPGSVFIAPDHWGYTLVELRDDKLDGWCTYIPGRAWLLVEPHHGGTQVFTPKGLRDVLVRLAVARELAFCAKHEIYDVLLDDEDFDDD